ncbi:hypothetical protein JOD82_001705 [Paenibacillus sp. 1182]|uniref:hypothetical protein n=1 Tax=Paenibacillus sp. 1182 TaxID=2806565 RepID=UPI001AE56B00|nr:hypothetical protein [Paenibacillus sp. 1182]MBP1308685.1 hypothetical protein [Paenibacillus sp. 1182]
MKSEACVYLCSIIVLNEYQQLLFDETFLVKVENVSESVAIAWIMQKLNEIETAINAEMNYPILLSCHCQFPMPGEVCYDALSVDELRAMFPQINEWKKE